MRDKLIQLKNTLGLIETKGNNTLIMADCLKFLEQCIQECQQDDIKNEKPETATE